MSNMKKYYLVSEYHMAYAGADKTWNHNDPIEVEAHSVKHAIAVVKRWVEIYGDYLTEVRKDNLRFWYGPKCYYVYPEMNAVACITDSPIPVSLATAEAIVFARR